ncbi:MAG: oligosaccharide flippase family protein [Sedimentisphaerales bacterium]|nr:oligosaccharide flippase family protein [Sedimentisphaerales bacterium]
MLRLIRYLRNSQFFKNISIVMTGTIVAQGIGFAIAPVISRLFTPSDFGVLGSFNSVLIFLAAFVTLQYAQAIMLPKRDQDAANVFAASILSVFIVSLIALLVAYLCSDWLLELLKSPQSAWLLWFLPLGVFVAGINQSFQAWCVRRKAFAKTASSQMVRAGSIGTLQIVSGLLHQGSGGLITSIITANGIASVNLSRQVFVTDRKLLKESLNWRQIGKKAKEYRDFPIYSATQTAMNALSQGLPVLLLAHFYGIAVAGAYAFGLRLLSVPINFVLIALRQVLFQKASETYNKGGRLLPLFIKITSGLFGIASIPSLILFIWAPQIFTWMFGAEWHTAGIYARWLIPWIAVLFCNAPASLCGRILRQQRNLFIFELIVLVSRASVLVIGGFYLSALQTVILFSVLGFLLNMLLILWIGSLLVTSEKSICTQLKS